MALVKMIVCDTCEKERSVSYRSGDIPPKTCSSCVALKEAEEKRAALEATATLPIEERLKILEEFMYDHQRKYHHPRPFAC